MCFEVKLAVVVVLVAVARERERGRGREGTEGSVRRIWGK